jgi:hypothetical protein
MILHNSLVDFRGAVEEGRLSRLVLDTADRLWAAYEGTVLYIYIYIYIYIYNERDRQTDRRAPVYIVHLICV